MANVGLLSNNSTHGRPSPVPSDSFTMENTASPTNVRRKPTNYIDESNVEVLPTPSPASGSIDWEKRLQHQQQLDHPQMTQGRSGQMPFSPQQPYRINTGTLIEPQTLRQTFWATVAWDIHDVVLVLLPVGLIIKAGLCIHASKIDADHHGVNFDQTSAFTKNLVRFNEQLTTLFTVLFIMIIGSTVKRYALYKAQKGAKLADLEQLNSSVSMTSTFKAIFSLRAFTWMSVFLLFIWSWYYVGSQASEREYTFQESGPMHDIQLAYVSNHATSPFLDGPLSSFGTVKRTDLTSRYHTYISRVQRGVSETASDIDGYPLTPYYDNTPANRIDPKHMRKIDAQGWLDTSEFSIQHVVNAIGTTLYANFDNPTAAQHSAAWTTGAIIGDFIYETTNYFANCSHTSLLRQTTYPGLLPVMTLSINMTNTTGAVTGNTPRTFNVWELYNSTHSLQATCALSEIHTDVQVACTAEGCKAVAVRPTPNHAYPTFRTVFDNQTFANEFFNSLLFATGVPDSASDLTMLEADNGWESLKAQLQSDQAAGIHPQADLNYDAYAFALSIGLTVHINTYYSAAMYAKYEHENDIKLMQSDVDSFTINPSDPDYAFVNLRGAEVSLRYELSMPWIIVDIISNFILLVAAAFSVYLRRVTLAPDLFGYVSSLTRDNPNVTSMQGGSAMSGMERARRMRNIRVKLGDIGLQDDMGRIAISQDANQVGQMRKLNRLTSYA